MFIHNLSKEHFGYLPIDPPKDILSKIPSELPPFLDKYRRPRVKRKGWKTRKVRVFEMMCWM
jgi:hypothetical protein